MFSEYQRSNILKGKVNVINDHVLELLNGIEWVIYVPCFSKLIQFTDNWFRKTMYKS